MLTAHRVPTSSTWLQPLPLPSTVPRRVDLDALRGVAIFLVVIGHAVAREIPAGNGWYWVLKDLIYRFHMPLFMTLTGITFGMSVPVFRNWAEARAYSWRKSVRLAVPYFVVGLLIIAGKLSVGQFLYVDKPAQPWPAEVVTLLLVPWKSAAGFLWFIYVLSFYLLLIPSALFVLKRRPLMLLAVAIALQALPWPDLLMLDRVVSYLPFYCLGIVLCLRRGLWSPLPGWIGWPSVAAFAALLASAYVLEPPDWIVGAVSVPAVLMLVQRAHDGVRRFWAFIGLYSMAIYLLNTIVIGVTKGVMLKWHGWEGDAFFVFFPVLVLVGCGVPIVVKRWADRHAPRLTRYL